MAHTIPLTILFRGAIVRSLPWLRHWALGVVAAAALHGGAANATQCSLQTSLPILPWPIVTPATSIYPLGASPVFMVENFSSPSLSAVDYWGNPITLGATAVETGLGWKVTLPPQEKVGYYELTATAGGVTGCLQYAVVGPSTPDKRFGVVTQIGFGNPPGLESAVHAAGIGAVKDSLSWQSAKPTVGASLTVPTTFDTYMSTLARDDITPLLVLAFGNPAFEPSGSGDFTLPYGYAGSGQTDISAYAAYGAALAGRYGNPGLGVSIWNEVNGSFCQGPACSTTLSIASAYSTLTKTASAAVHKAAPAVSIVGGATYGVTLPWFEDLFYTGTGAGCPTAVPTTTPSTNAILGAIDEIDIHWYGRPEDLDQSLQDLTTLSTKCGGQARPIVATEVGPNDFRFTTDGYQTGVHQSPNEFVRDAAVLLGRNVAAMYWYVLHEVTMSITGDPENLLQAENSNLYVPTSTYSAYANLISEMAGMTAQTQSNGSPTGNIAPDNRSKIYAFKNAVAGTQLYIGWAVPEMLNADLTGLNPAHVAFTATGPTTISNVMGQPIATYSSGSSVSLTLTASPVYIEVQGTGVVTFQSTDPALLASSADDFGTVYPAATPTAGIGNNGWSYGWINASTGGASSVALGFQAGFQPATWSDGAWIEPGTPLVLDRNTQAPIDTYVGTTHVSRWAVRRWTCPSTGPACSVAISGQVQLSSALGAGVSVLVIANDTVQYAVNLVPANGVAPGASIGSPANTSEPLLVTVAPGKPIDFAVTTGPGALVDGYDSTGLLVWIANAPQAQSQVKVSSATKR